MAFTYKPYEESDELKKARAQMEAAQVYNQSQRVTDLQNQYDSQLKSKDSILSPYKTALDSALDKINNRQAFSYDINSDALYNQYKQQYTQLGKLAMQDATGQAAALTGGYGNSYAATAGNQAYQQYLTQLNDKVPELYSLAMDKYKMEGDELANQYALASDRYNIENTDYQNTLDRLQADYNAERNFDYGQFTDNRNYAMGRYNTEADRDYDFYSLGADIAKTAYSLDQALNQWQSEFDEGKEQFNAELAEEQRQYNTTLAEQQRQADLDYQLSLAKASSSSSSKSTYKSTKATKPTSFIASIRTQNEFNRSNNEDKQAYGNYKSYVQAMVGKYSDSLSDGDIKWLEENGYI